MKKDLYLFPVNLALFDGTQVLNRTTDEDLSPEMKEYYNTNLIKMAGPKLVHDQFGQKQDIPRNGGKTIEFRKYSPLPTLTKPLTEGVTPSGQQLKVSKVTATIDQYGGFVPVTDVLSVTAVDHNITEATELLAQQAGKTLDGVTREVLSGGTNVIYAGGVSARYELDGEEESKLTVDMIERAVYKLKSMDAPTIDGYYVAIVHPAVAYDLRRDPQWVYPHQYVDTEEIYAGELGRIAGVRFVETTLAKKFVAPDLSSGSKTLTADVLGDNTITIRETLTDADALALVGRKIIVGEMLFTVVSATTNNITVDGNVDTVPSDTIIYPGEAGAEGRDVYSTLVLGANAYGVTKAAGLGLEHIFKPLGSGGTSDPLNQRASAAWKASKTAIRLVEEYMVRIETASTFNDGKAN